MNGPVNKPPLTDEAGEVRALLFALEPSGCAGQRAAGGFGSVGHRDLWMDGHRKDHAPEGYRSFLTST